MSCELSLAPRPRHELLLGGQNERSPLYYHILNWGMGRESTAILVRWILDPSSRPESYPGSGVPMSLSQLVVIVAQTGHEYETTKWLCEQFVLPLLRQHNIRLIQGARRSGSESDDIVILEDTRQPFEIHSRPTLERPYWRLGDEYEETATLPLLSGAHLCAQKFKGFVLDRIIDRLEAEAKQLYGTFCFGPYLGYSTDEYNRISRSNEYGCRGELYRYPLHEWLASTQWCIDYLFAQFGVLWKKSACHFCPYLSLEYAEGRYEESPEGLLETLQLEWTAQLFNPRIHIFGHQTAWHLAHALNSPALGWFEDWMQRIPQWKLFRCRRIYKGSGHESAGTPPRFIESLAQGTYAEMDTLLREHPGDLTIQSQVDLTCLKVTKSRGVELGLRVSEARLPRFTMRPVPRKVLRRKDWLNLPSVDDLLVVAPATVQSKVHYANNFYDDWFAITGEAIQSPFLQQQIWKERQKYMTYTETWRIKIIEKIQKSTPLFPDAWMDEMQARSAKYPHRFGVESIGEG